MFDESGFVAVATELAAADPAGCDRDGLAGLVGLSQRARGWLDAFDSRIALRAAALAAEGRCEAASDVLAGGGRVARRAALDAAARAGVCEEMPGFHTALAAGAVSAGHLDALAGARRGLSDIAKAALRDRADDLLGSAKQNSVEDFERECRDLAARLTGDEGESRLAGLRAQRRVRRWVDKFTGMCKTMISLDPEQDAVMWTAINAALRAACAGAQDPNVNWDHLVADTVVGLITGSQSLDPRIPEVSVLIDLTTLLHGLHDDSVSETSAATPMPPATVRRMCCEGAIIPIVLGAAGEVLDVGREVRLANRAQRRALRAMYRTCAHPGCTVVFDVCRIHHVVAWEHGGATDLANLIPLCGAHHHLVHEGRWRLTMTADRVITLTRPDGTTHHHGPTMNRATAGRSPPQTSAA